MGFLTPWFLGGLAALGVPVFVHLLRRHVTPPRPVSSLMFFERGTQSSTRHRRLKYLLLFALRATLVLLVVLAFAQPFVRRPPNSGRGHLLLIVLDNSFSMHAAARFAQAKQQALAALSAKPHGAAAQIMALGGRVELLTQPITDDAQLRSALESTQPGDGHANFGDLGRTVRSLAETVHEPIDLHLFSDMQRTAMPSNFADMVLPASVVLTLHSVAEPTPTPNWTIETVEAPVELPDPKDLQRSHVRAVIAGFNTPASQKTVSLIINGKTAASRKVEIPANGRARVDFAPLDVGYGFNRCSVRIEGNDAFPADDATVFAVRRSDLERVLFVHATGETRSATYFGSALSAAAPGSFIVQSVPAEQTTDLDPWKYSFVVLSDVLILPSIFEHALAQYVARGGDVFIALGTHSGRRAQIPLWGAGIVDVRDFARAGTAATLGQVDFSFPALAQSQPGRDNGGWIAVKIFYVSVVDRGPARVAARLADGTPLLLDKQIGEGHVLLFTSGLDNLTNDLPLHPVFVAFVDHAAGYLSGTERLTGSQLVDSFVQLRSSGEPVGALANVEVIDPDGRRPLSLDEARTAQTFRLARAGFYQIHFANGREAVIGVNPDRLESNLEPLPPDILKLWNGSATPTSFSQPAGSLPAESADRTVNLWWYVMLLALVAALAESTVASRYMGTQQEEG